MALPLPGSLTPSKVATFKECALAFRLSAIDRLPEAPSEAAFKGTVVHRALELLMWEEGPGRRDQEAAFSMLGRALDELLASREALQLGLSTSQLEDFAADARTLLTNYLALEDPNAVRVIGTELRLEAQVDGLRLRGIIDRLELDRHGQLVVTDYKTGRAPSAGQEQARLGGVNFYALLCQEVLGRRPARVQLFHLREPLAISSEPSDQSITSLRLQASAIWAAVKRACLREDFRPRPGPLCDWCGYHAYCPAQGGDLSLLAPADGAAVLQPDGAALLQLDGAAPPEANGAAGPGANGAAGPGVPEPTGADALEANGAAGLAAGSARVPGPALSLVEEPSGR